MPMTMKQMAANTPRDRKLMSQYVVLSNVKKKNIKPGLQRYLSATTYSTHVMDPKLGVPVKNKLRTKYRTEVLSLQGDSKPLGKSYLKVSCECGDFWCHWEYALNKRGASDIQYSNGEPPVVTNPRNIAGVCKHIMALFMQIQAHGW